MKKLSLDHMEAVKTMLTNELKKSSAEQTNRSLAMNVLFFDEPVNLLDLSENSCRRT